MLELTNTLSNNQEITKLAPKALIDLFILDATALGADDVLRFHPGTDVKQSVVLFRGQSYVPFPVEIKGFAYKAQGELPRPTVRFANVSGLFKDLCLAYDNLLGAKVTRKRVYASSLDANWVPEFEGQIQPEFPEEVFFIDQKKGENKLLVEFELGTLPDVEGIQLPRRLVMGDNCPFLYRRECPYSHNVVVTDRYGAEIAGAIKYTGAFNELYTYTPGMSASVGNLTYQCVTATTAGESPTSAPAKWTLIQSYKGLYDKTLPYSAKDVVYILGRGGAAYYFYAPNSVPAGMSPPNTKYWTADECTKKVNSGCIVHFDPTGINNPLPYGGFVGTIKLPSFV